MPQKRYSSALPQRQWQQLTPLLVAASCHDGATAAQLWDVLVLGNELLERLQTVFVDGTAVSAAAFTNTWPSVACKPGYPAA